MNPLQTQKYTLGYTYDNLSAFFLFFDINFVLIKAEKLAHTLEVLIRM